MVFKHLTVCEKKGIIGKKKNRIVFCKLHLACLIYVQYSIIDEDECFLTIIEVTAI